jgi:hypothetical protein
MRAVFACRFDAKYEEAVVKFCEDNMKEDDKGKWRCLLPPNKLFEVLLSSNPTLCAACCCSGWMLTVRDLCVPLAVTSVRCEAHSQQTAG